MKRLWTGKALKPIQFGILASVLAALVYFLAPASWLGEERELFFDTLTQWAPQPANPHIVVVDIDRKTLNSITNRNWSRADSARLVAAIADAKPAAIALDPVFSGHCDRQDADNQALAAAIAKAPTILGFLLSDTKGEPPRPALPLAAAKGLQVPAAWFIDAAEAACPIFSERAEGAAGVYLFGDQDARVRRIAAFSILDGAAYPALAIEAARLANGPASPPILTGNPLRLRLGSRILSLSENGNLRFSASPQDVIAKRTISAADLLAGKVPPERLADKVVLVGSSLPNFGGLRASASMPLEPSVQIQADLASGILSGFLPVRNAHFKRYEALFVLVAGIAIALAAARLRPFLLASFGIGVIGMTLAGCYGIYTSSGYLIDGFSISLALIFILSITTYLQFSRVRATETRARQRFGQYLPQSVVARYLDDPEGERLAGERREVTALFTDIEGFSTLTKSMPTADMVALLDVYFSEVNALVGFYGGMVDKVVGDAVHALFNAPDDLDDHVNKAISCASAIRQLTEDMRQRPQFAACDFGRTRIGVETGPAILGEVGAGGRLDYTAHGEAINLAARLQEANKFLGTSICIGPAAATVSGFELEPLGEHEIRGFGMVALFTLKD